MAKTLAEQVIWPLKGKVTVDGCEGATDVFFAYLGRDMTVLPISAIVERRNELKNEYGRTYDEANGVLMLELRALQEGKSKSG